MRLLTFLLLVICDLLLTTSPTRAISAFSTNYTITYDIDEQGIAHVNFDIDQKNNLSAVYATSFSLSLSQTNLTNIKVKDEFGTIIPEIDRTNNLTNISFNFVGKVVGKDKINQFNVQYDSSDIISRQGSVWEINIPKLEPNENTNSQQIILKVPISFGQPAYMDPKPNRVNGNIYYFNSAVLANKSISAIFGSTQFFKLQLIYHLPNPSIKNLTTQIALPPDTPYQTVLIKKIDPPPNDIALDPDGNWLASYTVNSQSDLQIVADLIIKLSFNPQTTPPPDNSLYTRSLKLWDYENSEVTAKAIGLTTPKAVYDFVASHLQYDFARATSTDSDINRPGAVWALTNPAKAICTEFSDLFIALARKNGIPSRELQGYAISSNDKLKPISLSRDILHAWPEYYDPNRQTWIQVDPTWANTTGGIDYFSKLDLNHLVFVVHGLDATKPLPAGTYKTIGGGSKDVFVSVTDPENFPPPSFQINYQNQDRKHLYLNLNNTSGTSGTATIKASDNSIVQPTEISRFLPPYSHNTIELDFNKGIRFYPIQKPLIIELNGQKTTINLTWEPNLPIIVAYITGISVAAGLALIARSLYFRRQKRRSPVHW